MAFSLSSAVNEEFKMMGLSLKGDAMEAVVSFLERAEDANASLSLMLDALDARSLTSSIVDKQVVDETTRALDRAAGVTGVEMDARGVPAAHGCSGEAGGTCSAVSPSRRTTPEANRTRIEYCRSAAAEPETVRLV